MYAKEKLLNALFAALVLAALMMLASHLLSQGQYDARETDAHETLIEGFIRSENIVVSFAMSSRGRSKPPLQGTRSIGAEAFALLPKAALPLNLV